MSHNKRMSESFTLPREQAPFFSGTPAVPADDSEKWMQDWHGVFARGESETLLHRTQAPLIIIMSRSHRLSGC